MPSEGGHGRQGKKESLVKALDIAAGQITLVIETYRDDTITSNHDFTKIPRKDLEVLFHFFQNLKKLYNDYLGQEGDDPRIKITTPEGVVEVLGSTLIRTGRKLG